MIAVVVRLPVISDDLPARPRTRAECADVPRPCPYVSCSMNTYLDVDDRGRIRINATGLEPDEVDPALSCALDVADDGGASLRDVGRVLDVTRERARQIETHALKLMRRPGHDIGEPVGDGDARPPTYSRAYRREPRVDEPEVEDEPVVDLERVSFFSADEARVLRHVWRVYARRIGVSTVSVFSREATAARQRRGASAGLLFGAGKRR